MADMRLWIALTVLAAAGLASALDFEMQQQTKCIFEELNANVIVVGDYKAANKDNPSLPIYVNVKVCDTGDPGSLGQNSWHPACPQTVVAAGICSHPIVPLHCS